MRRRDLIAAHERTVQVLLDEIYWLRAFCRPEASVSYTPVAAVEQSDPTDAEWARYWEQQAQVEDQKADLTPQHTIGDDEDAIKQMLANDEIDIQEAEALLSAVGAQSTTIEFAS